MLRVISEVPGYFLAAISGVGLVLFGQFIYLCFREAHYDIILIGFILLFGKLLVSNTGRLDLIRLRQTLDSWALASIARLGTAIAIAIFPMLLIYRHTGITRDARLESGSYVTQAGGYSCQRLPDWSKVCLNSNSVVRYTFSKYARHVELVSGEASFVVLTDRTRSFNVVSGEMLIHAVGSAFTVHKNMRSTQIAVIEGSVRIVAPIAADLRIKFGRAEAIDAWRNAREYYRLQRLEFDEATRKIYPLSTLSESGLSQLLSVSRLR